MKNRVHQALESSCIKISSVLTAIFGKSGQKILNGLLEGKMIDEILAGIKAKKGTKKAAVALARKLLCILHHLLIKREMYHENGNTKSNPVKFDRTSSPIQMTEQDMISVLSNAGYIIKKMDARGCI